MKIAICSSKLEHVTRGVETWAKDTAQALYERGIDVALYKGSGPARFPYEKSLRSIKENTRISKKISALLPGFLWRFGLGKADQLEETTFAFNVFIEAIKHRFDIIHTQDAHVANFLRFMNKYGLLKSKVILGHGTEEPFEFLNRFKYVQHLAPFHQEEAEAACGLKQNWFAISNFVDILNFKPLCEDGKSLMEERLKLRSELGIPSDAFVILSVAAVKSTHKRIDYLIHELDFFLKKHLNHTYLVVAGSTTKETEQITQLGHLKLGDRVRFLLDQPHARLPGIYRMADLFVLCSLKEMMPIALLEALASGLPCLGNKYPVIEWMIAEGGECFDMVPQALANAFKKYLDKDYRQFVGIQARAQAVRCFSKDVVIGEYIGMYERIASL